MDPDCDKRESREWFCVWRSLFGERTSRKELDVTVLQHINTRDCATVHREQQHNQLKARTHVSAPAGTVGSRVKTQLNQQQRRYTSHAVVRPSRGRGAPSFGAR